jgi:chromosome segregation ATPase
MTTRTRSVVAMMFVAAVAVLATSYSLRAASPTAQVSDPMTALLGEVHALRIAMEQSATVAPRVQLTLGRLNIEEQRIAQLAVQLDQVRRELTAASLESQKLAEQSPEVEKGLQTAADDKTRRGYEFEQVALKQKIQAQSRLEQQLRTRENEAARLLGAEQSRWVDLNARLDELERLLGPVPR